MADFVGCRTFDRRKIYGQIVDPTTPPPPPNQAPVAADDHSPADFVAHGHSNLTAQGNVIDGSSGGADIDADGDALIIVGVSAGSHAGQLNGNTADVFSYTVSDGHGGFDTALLSVAIYDATQGGGVPGEGDTGV